MSWNYSGNPADSPLDYYRFKIGDTDQYEQLMTDEEINYCILKFNDENRILYNLFDRLAVTFSIDAIESKLGPESESTVKRAEFITKMRDYYSKRITDGGTPTYFQGNTCKKFRLDMFENVKAR